MPPSFNPSGLASTGLASSAQSLPAGTPLPRDFGPRRPAPGDRLPMALAAAIILGLSITLWFVLIQAGRMTLGLVGL